jgi:hypothetical protein
MKKGSRAIVVHVTAALVAFATATWSSNSNATPSWSYLSETESIVARSVGGADSNYNWWVIGPASAGSGNYYAYQLPYDDGTYGDPWTDAWPSGYGSTDVSGNGTFITMDGDQNFWVVNSEGAIYYYNFTYAASNSYPWQLVDSTSTCTWSSVGVGAPILAGGEDNLYAVGSGGSCGAGCTCAGNVFLLPGSVNAGTGVWTSVGEDVIFQLGSSGTMKKVAVFNETESCGGSISVPWAIDTFNAIYKYVTSPTGFCTDGTWTSVSGYATDITNGDYVLGQDSSSYPTVYWWNGSAFSEEALPVGQQDSTVISGIGSWMSYGADGTNSSQSLFEIPCNR